MIRIATWKIFIAAAVGLTMLVGCETPPPPSGFPQLSFSHLPPIKLNVAQVKIVSEFRSTGVKPNVEHLFPVKPQAAAERWSRERLKAVGASGTARVTIRRASVVEIPLSRSTGVRAMLTTDQTERYDGVIEIAIAILDGAGRQTGAVVSRAQRSKSVPEDISLLLENADALDSVICALAGWDFLSGEARPPTNPYRARKEGWIWVCAPDSRA